MMRKKLVVIILLFSIIISNLFIVSSYARVQYTYCNGLKIKKMYVPDEEYWIIGIAEWKTPHIKVPALADDGLEITGIYDTSSSRGVFQGNLWLESVDLSSSKVWVIGSNCFENCTKLKEYKNSPYLREICGHAFANANLDSISLNEGLEKICISAFEDAFSDEKTVHVIDIPDSVNIIGENAFKITNKNYRIVLVGKKGSVAEEYCKTDTKCTFVERGDKIPTEEDLLQEEIKKEKSKLFVNKEFRYNAYNNTNEADKTYIFGYPAASLQVPNLECYNDIIEVDDGYIAVGSSYIDKFEYSSITSKYFKETFLSKAKGNEDGIIVKYNTDLTMEWFQVFGGGLNDRFSKIYRTREGGYVAFGLTCSINGDLLGINNDANQYSSVAVKYDRNFKIKAIDVGEYIDLSKKYEKEIIIEDQKGQSVVMENILKTKSGRIELNTISNGREGVITGVNGYEMNTIIRKYDTNRNLEWTKIYDRNSKMTNDRLVKAIEVSDGFIFVGKSISKTKGLNNQEIDVEDAIIVKYNKPYDQIMINGMLQFQMNIGEQRAVNVSYVPWEDVTIGEMQWTSEDENVATVDYKGNITARGLGTTKVILNVRGKTQTIIVKVIGPITYPLQNISLDKDNLTLGENETASLAVKYNPIDTTDDKTITWTSSNEKVATVDTNGNIKGISEGTAQITAKVGQKTATCNVTVKFKLPFSDVATNEWYYEGIKFTYQNNMLKGYSDTKFAPFDKITRGQLVTILYRIEKEPDVSKLNNKFTDVKEGEYYTNAVKWANSKGIVTGYGGTTKFGPNSPILRQDFAIILQRYSKYKKKNSIAKTDIGYFTDYKYIKGGYAEDAINWAVAEGIISGKELTDGKKAIKPRENATRAETAVMLTRFVNNLGLKI